MSRRDDVAATPLDAAVDEVVDAAHELAQAFSEIRRCTCGRLTRQVICPRCGERCQHSWVRRIENIYRVVCERCRVER